MKLDVRSPFDGSHVGSVDLAGPGCVDRALDAAHTLFRDRSSWLSPAVRLAVLAKTAELMEREADALARQAAGEGGSPWGISCRNRPSDRRRSKLLRADTKRTGPRDTDGHQRGVGGSNCVHDQGADRRGRGRERVQPSAQSHRASGRASYCGRLPRYCQASQRNSPILLPFRRNPSRGGIAGRVVSRDGDRRQ